MIRMAAVVATLALAMTSAGSSPSPPFYAAVSLPTFVGLIGSDGTHIRVEPLYVSWLRPNPNGILPSAFAPDRAAIVLRVNSQSCIRSSPGPNEHDRIRILTLGRPSRLVSTRCLTQG